MTLPHEQYLIDSNALSFLSREQRASKFFQKTCRIPGEVLHEARFFPDIQMLEQVEYPTTPEVLRILREVMATVPVGDTSLVDLYRDRGNADPLVVACAVDAQNQSSAGLFGPRWVIVSNDSAVRAKATEFGIEVKTKEEFVTILKAGPLPIGS